MATDAPFHFSSPAQRRTVPLDLPLRILRRRYKMLSALPEPPKSGQRTQSTWIVAQWRSPFSSIPAKPSSGAANGLTADYTSTEPSRERWNWINLAASSLIDSLSCSPPI